MFSSYFFKLQKIIFYKVFKAGSGSAFKKQLDPDPHGDKLPDPQPWFHLYFSLIYIYFGKVHLQRAGQKREEGGDRRGKERRRGLAQVSQEQGQPQV